MANIKNELQKIKDPNANADIIASGLVQSIDIKDREVRFILEDTPAIALTLEPLRQEIIEKISKIKGVVKVSGLVTAHSQPRQTQNPVAAERPKPNIQSIRPDNIGKMVAIASGKGGVGKSTIAFNLALALARQGKKVGLLDADIYGPSVPTLLGMAKAKAQTDDDGKLIPLEGLGLKSMSIGYVVDKDKALIWRGPMLLKALTQLFMGTAWGKLDYLIVDLPPGTGDVQLSLAQQARLDGIIMVATPQEMALADVRRGIDMFQKANVPILGMIENMSVLYDEASGNKIDIYGQGGAKKCAQDLGLNFLGEIYFHPKLRMAADNGEATPEVAISQFDEIAKILNS